MTSEARAIHSPHSTRCSWSKPCTGTQRRIQEAALWENLPKKMMYQTYSVIIAYLQDSGKIAPDAEGKICWIYNPELIKRYLHNNDLKIR